jgi:DNA polymerase III epsilon subunit-like protein
MSSNGTEKRQLVVVDTETSGLDHTIHQVVEVGWWNLTTGKRGEFIPPHDVRDVLAKADLRALQINRYIDRIATALQDERGVAAMDLAEQLAGNTLVAVNPSFDAPFLADMFTRYECGLRGQEAFCAPEWHYRMWDINSYAAGVLGLDELPGLERLCGLLDTTFGPDHTAHGDVTAAGHCFVELRKRAQANAFRRAVSTHA